MVLNLGGAPHDSDDIQDLWYALQQVGIIDPDGDSSTISNSRFQEAPAYGHTPYGATKTAELEVQFSIDPSFGLSRERYGWFSDGVLFDRSNFDTTVPRIKIETKADGASTARIRSAYPGQYVSHTIAEPGFGAEINEDYVETDEDNLVSLTHGEIKFAVGSINGTGDTDFYNSHGITYRDDGVYHQVTANGDIVSLVPQEDWSIDPMDGTGPSGETLNPDGGYIYQFIYTWYGEGAMILAVQDPFAEKLIPLNSYVPNRPERPAVSSPNLPVQAITSNEGVAEPLSYTLGGMQYAVHGVGKDEDTTRTTEESRFPPSGFISDNVTLVDEAVSPYDTTVVPLIAAKRNTEPEVEKGLRLDIANVLADADSDIFVFVFDEFDEAGAGLDGEFKQARSRSPDATDESKILTNTNCTTYSPTEDSVIRGYSYIPSSKNDPALVTAGDTSTRVPLRATVVVAAALAPGANNTTVNPIVVPFKEGF